MNILDEAQKRALEIYISSATIENDYKPLSLAKIAEQLTNEGFKTSSSALQRWSIKYQFKEHLNTQLQLTIIDDESKTTQERALAKTVEKRLVDINRNNELTADCYELMELFSQQVANNFDTNGTIKRDDIKIIKDIAVFTGGREDKLLDRIANQGDEKITSEELKQQFEDIDVEIEDE